MNCLESMAPRDREFLTSLSENSQNTFFSLPEEYKKYFINNLKFYLDYGEVRYLTTYPEKCREILDKEYNENNLPLLENRNGIWALIWIIENLSYEELMRVEYHENFKDFQNLEWEHLKVFPEFSQRKTNKDPSILNRLPTVENRTRLEVCDWIKEHMDLYDLLYVGL